MKYLFWILLTLLIIQFGFELLLGDGQLTEKLLFEIGLRFSVININSLINWVSSVVAMMSAGLAWHISNYQDTKTAKYSWWMIFFVLLYVSVDQIARISNLFVEIYHWISLLTFAEEIWVILLVPLSIILVTSFRLINHSLHKRIKLQLLGSFIVFLIGEFILRRLLSTVNDGLFSSLAVAGKAIQYAGLWLILFSLMDHIKRVELTVYKHMQDLYK